MTKQTFLRDKHVELGAKMVDFAGWYMPVQYTSIIEEHHTVRNSVGVFDVSHMGEVFVQGKDALAFLTKLVPQDLTGLVAGKAIYCQLTNHNGGVIDDIIVYKLADEKYFIIHNASRVDEDVNWMAVNKKGFDVEIINDSHKYSMLAIQGPKACELMNNIGVKDLPSFFAIKEGEVFGLKAFISRTGYTGEDGVEVIVKNEDVEELWDKILDAGKAYGIKPIGLGARDTLRLEAALHLYGNDLDENTTPIEAGLAWSVCKTKTEFYNGKEVIEKQLAEGGNKKLVALKMIDRGIARHGYDVYDGEEKIGVITSGGISPTRGDNVALAYVKNDKKYTLDAVVGVMIRDKVVKAQIIKKPFVTKRNKVEV